MTWSSTSTTSLVLGTCIQKRSSAVLHAPALHCIRLRWRRCADAVSLDDAMKLDTRATDCQSAGARFEPWSESKLTRRYGLFRIVRWATQRFHLYPRRAARSASFDGQPFASRTHRRRDVVKGPGPVAKPRAVQLTQWLSFWSWSLPISAS